MGLCSVKQEPKVNTNDQWKDKYRNEENLGIRSKLVRHTKIDNIFSIYNKIKKLGDGASCSVYEVALKSSPNKYYALKEIKKNKLDQDLMTQFYSEIQILIEVDHPNIIRLYDTYEDETSFYLCMEECTGGELFDYLNSHPNCKLTEYYAAHLIIQMLHAISYLHSKKICHRDLKLENFVFHDPTDESTIKLIDFGLSCKYQKVQKMKSLVGTPYYMAPEVIKQDEYDLQCDIWSLGVITYMLVSGIPPFNGKNQFKIMERAVAGLYDYPEQYFSSVSQDLKDFIDKMLVVEPNGRMTSTTALKHKWIKNYGNERDKLSADVLKSFVEYNQVSKLKRTALEVIAFNMTEQEIDDLRHQFHLIDQDGNGTISLQELKNVLVSAGISAQQSEAIFNSIDNNNSGLISYSEFMAATLKRKMALNESSIIEAFKRMDVDGNGYLEISDFRKLLGGQFDEEEVKQMIASADTSKDGRIDIDEFIAMMKDISA